MPLTNRPVNSEIKPNDNERRNCDMECPKCSTETSKGWVVKTVDYTTDGAVKTVKCLNCGWRPEDRILGIGKGNALVKQRKKRETPAPRVLKAA